MSDNIHCKSARPGGLVSINSVSGSTRVQRDRLRLALTMLTPVAGLLSRTFDALRGLTLWFSAGPPSSMAVVHPVEQGQEAREQNGVSGQKECQRAWQQRGVASGGVDRGPSASAATASGSSMAREEARGRAQALTNVLSRHKAAGCGV